MATEHRYFEMDVFTDRPGYGNPVAVVLDAASLSTEQMQRFANWVNFSETTFVTGIDDSSYQVRIFTPFTELPFAGHPSVGTAQALLQAELIRAESGALVQHCGAGALPLQLDDSRVFVRVPHLASLDMERVRGELERFLACRADGAITLQDVGPKWLIARVDSREQLNQVQLDLPALKAITRSSDSIGLTLFASENGETFVRTLCPEPEVMEDPVCGSGNGAVAYHRMQSEDLRIGEKYVAKQGEVLGRDGRVHVRLKPDGVWVGGDARRVVRGEALIA